MLLRLQDDLWTEALAFAGCSAGRNLCLASRELLKELWHSEVLWTGLLVGHHRVPREHLRGWGVADLRDEYRHRSFGIDRLFSWRLQPALAAAAPALAAATRAVRGILPSDTVQDAAIASVVDLMRWCDVTDVVALRDATELLQTIVRRTDTFSVAQVRDVWEAYSDSLEYAEDFKEFNDPRFTCVLHELKALLRSAPLEELEASSSSGKADVMGWMLY